MPASGGEANEFERLKTLLFSPEADRLSAAETHIHELESWVGDAPKLETATAQILVEAFRRAEVARHRELAAAVAPVVVAAIRNEIANSRDMMVEALYPITGRLVAAAVANAFSELLDAINQRLDALVSTHQWRLRFRSIVTGRSIAEIALSEAREATYARILLLERGSGRLLAHWRPGGEGQDNPDLISGMLAAISEFASNVLSEQHGELRTLDLGGSQVFLRASSRVILAAELTGPVSRKNRETLDAGFLDLVDRNDRGETLGEADLAALALPVAEPVAKRRGWAPWVALMILAALILAWAWNGPIYRWRKDSEISEAYRQALAADPAARAYPLSVEEDFSAKVVTLRGLAASEQEVEGLLAKLTPAAAPLKMERDVAIVASTAELADVRSVAARQGEELARLREALRTQSIDLAEARAKLAEESGALVDASARSLREEIAGERTRSDAAAEELRRALGAARGESAAAIEGLNPRMDALASGLASTQAAAEAAREALSAPRMAIAAAAADMIIFFGERDGFLDPAAAAKTLDSIAQAIKQTGEGVRVVGYADETGSATGNIDISRQRAAVVSKQLIERGVAPNKLVSVGRGALWPITDAGPTQSRNRRVAFEPLYPGEPQ